MSPAPKILSDVPVSRTLWTVFVPKNTKSVLDETRAIWTKVGAAYQQEERKLSFLDELQQMVQVASRKGKSARPRRHATTSNNSGPLCRTMPGRAVRSMRKTPLMFKNRLSGLRRRSSSWNS